MSVVTLGPPTEQSVKSTNQSYENKKNSLESKIVGLQKKVDEAHAEYEAMKTSKQAAESRLGQLRYDYAEKDGQPAFLAAEKKIETEINSFENKIMLAEVKLSSARRNLVHQKELLVKLQDSQDALKSTYGHLLVTSERPRVHVAPWRPNPV